MQSREFNLKPSRFCLFLILLCIFSTLMVFLFLPLSLWIKGCGSIALLIYGSTLYRKVGLLKSETSIIRLIAKGDDEFCLIMPDQQCQAIILGDSTLTTVVSILRFRAVNGFRRYSCLIFRDSLLADEYRQLLVILKLR